MRIASGAAGAYTLLGSVRPSRYAGAEPKEVGLLSFLSSLLDTMSEKVAIVTGASSGQWNLVSIIDTAIIMFVIISGIGRQTAIALVGAGWKVTLTGRRQDALEATQQLCGDKSGNCLVIAGGITGEVFVKKLFEETVHHFGLCPLAYPSINFI